MEDLKEIKIQTKEWSNPTAAGLVALAVACFCFFGMLNGHFTGADRLLVGCWLLGGFVIQIVVAFVDLKGGNHTGGNTFLFFSAFFMLSAGLGLFMKFFYGGSATVDAYVWFAILLVMLLWTPAFFKKFSILSLIVLALDLALPLLVLADLNTFPYMTAQFASIAGWILLVAGLLAIYLSAAMVVNSAFGRKVYPLP
jgi:hypothetical protein